MSMDCLLLSQSKTISHEIVRHLFVRLNKIFFLPSDAKFRGASSVLRFSNNRALFSDAHCTMSYELAISWKSGSRWSFKIFWRVWDIMATVIMGGAYYSLIVSGAHKRTTVQIVNAAGWLKFE